MHISLKNSPGTNGIRNQGELIQVYLEMVVKTVVM